MRAVPILFVLCLGTALNAQAPASAPAAQPAPAAGQTAAPKGAVPAAAAPAEAQENYTYDPSGRRDPFLSLIGGGVDARPGVKRAEGSPGLAVAEIAVRGILQSRGSLVAMVQGPDNKTYVMHPGDRLVDGTVKTVTPMGLVIMQDVNDPLSLVKQREVRKLLRSFEDGKQ
jgi:type IV pilus assembly protein PilP